jgi:hypothetical protein
MLEPKRTASVSNSTSGDVLINGTDKCGSDKVLINDTTNDHPAGQQKTDYTSDGVADYNVFLLPGSDYCNMLLVTALGAAIRLFRIYQPSSVVWDEVQYVHRFMQKI